MPLLRGAGSTLNINGTGILFAPGQAKGGETEPLTPIFDGTAASGNHKGDSQAGHRTTRYQIEQRAASTTSHTPNTCITVGCQYHQDQQLRSEPQTEIAYPIASSPCSTKECQAVASSLNSTSTVFP